MKITNKEDLFGKVFGKIRIIGLSGDPHLASGCCYVYRCECGNEGKISASLLRRTAVPMCHACYMKNKLKDV